MYPKAQSLRTPTSSAIVESASRHCAARRVNLTMPIHIHELDTHVHHAGPPL